MSIGDKNKTEAMVERALFYRAQCIERAELAKLPEIKIRMEDLANHWERFAANIRRDIRTIEESRRLIAQADKLLRE